MGLEDDYRKHAGNLIQIASRQVTSADKGRLLLIAEAWLDLADRIGRRIKRRTTVEHPLVEQALERKQTDADQ